MSPSGGSTCRRKRQIEIKLRCAWEGGHSTASVNEETARISFLSYLGQCDGFFLPSRRLCVNKEERPGKSEKDGEFTYSSSILEAHYVPGTVLGATLKA